MAKNYLIGVGGTGARVIEAVVECCAAGLGPDELGIFLVDPDEANGNLSGTKALLADYADCRARFAERAGDTPLFRTVISTPAQPVWSIFSRQGRTLSEFIALPTLGQQNRALADMVSVLFTSTELSTALTEGFRGHPSIGAVAMSNPPMDADPWQTFWADVAGCQGVNEARVFLVGSIFGGTGAAGVPTFGARDVIKFHERAALDARTNSSRVLLGAALVLPYFSFDVDQNAAAREPMFVTPSDFPLATKAALEFYDTTNLAFDELYLIGDSLAQKVGAFSTGSQSQNNRPHYIELITALAAFDFFGQPKPPADRPRQYFAAARESGIVDWDALPVTRDAERAMARQADLKLQLGAMATFAYALATHGRETLEASHADVHDAWYKQHFRFNPKRQDELARDPRQAASREAFEAISAFGIGFLRWLGHISGDASVRLFDAKKVFDDGGELLWHRQHLPNIGRMLPVADSEGLSFSEFIADSLNDQRIENDAMRASDKLINLFYGAAVQFCRRNYRADAGVA